MVTKTATSQRVRWLSDPAYRFAGLVVVAAAAAVTLIATQGGFAGARHLSAAAVGIGAMIVISEFVPLKLPRRSNDTAFGASTLFAVAMLALCGTGMTLLWFAGAVAVHDLVRRKPAIKVAFNTAQFALAVAASGEVLGALSDLPAPGDAPPLTGADIPALMLAALVLSGLNHLMSAVVSSLASGASLRGRLRGGDGVILLLELLMVGFAPVVIVVADFSAWLLPVLVLPFGALLLSAREADRRHHDAMHDALTGLPNRTLFRQALSEELERCRHAGGAVAVLLLDLDRFKEINDALGHGSGDRVLVEVSRRLPTLVRDSDLVARLGGDEFGILVSRPRALEDVLRLAGRVRERLGEPVLLDRLRVAAGASIGVSLAAGSDAETLLRRADVAMYAAKERGVGVTVYEPADDPHSPERLQLLAELREGIAGGELAVHYQPKLSLLTDRIEGVEALVRWQHPTRGLLMPGDFLELAERSGLMEALTMEVLRQALAQQRAWTDDGFEVTVAVNISAQALMDQSLPGTVAELLSEHGVDPTMLRLEITESSLMRDPERSASVLEALAADGVRVAIDDFGTGYSSLAILQRLPVDEIKIDRSFVRDMMTSRNDLSIVRSTVDLARNLRLRVVAEGVETAATLEQLRAFGCHEIQGYLISRPVPGPAVDGLLPAAEAPLRAA